MITTKHIHSFSIDKTTRPEVNLNDPAYIRIYDESNRLGVRLAGKFNVPAGKLEFTETIKATFSFFTPPAYPSPRYYNGIAFDSSRGVHVLFGGVDDSVVYNETWEYNGSTWVQILPTVSPAARYSSTLVYDKARNRTVLFGGWPGANEIWEYDGATWTLILSSPVPMLGTGAAYDEDRQLIVFYSQGRTFEYDGTLTEVVTTEVPVGGFNTRMVYDIHRKRIVALESSWTNPDGTIIYPRLWEFYDGQWHKTQVERIGTTYAGFFYDRKNRCTVIFGGLHGNYGCGSEYYPKTVWVYDGQALGSIEGINAKEDAIFDFISYDENGLEGIAFGVVDYSSSMDRITNTMKVSLSDPLAIARLPEWNPQAVKGWGAFSERSRKPSGTSVLWRLGDGTAERWFNGTAWVPAVSEDEWNSETEVSAALPLFPLTARKIAPVAKLITFDRFSTPVLLGYDILIQAVFDWFEDLVLRSVVPRLKADFQFVTDFSAILSAGGSGFNFKTDRAFITEQDLNIAGIDSIFNHTLDPNHMTDILSSVNLGTGAVTLTGTVVAGTRLFIRYLVNPEVVVNFANSDYYEIGKTPTVIVENISIEAQQVQAFRELVDRARDKGWENIAPLWVKEMTCNCVLMAGGLVDLFRFYSMAAKVTLRGTHNPTDEQGALIHTPALDRRYTLKFLSDSRYNPKPNLADLKTVSFGLAVCNFYAWLRDLEEMPIVKSVNCSVKNKETSGPALGETLPVQPEPGEFGFVNTLPEVEDETTTEPGT